MKNLLVQIFILNLLPKSKWCNSILERKLIQLKNTYKISLSYKSVKIKNLNKILFADLSLNLIELGVNITFPKLLLHFNFLSTKKSLCSKLICLNFDKAIITLERTEEKERSDKSKKNYSTQQTPRTKNYHLFYKKILSIFFKNQSIKIDAKKISISCTNQNIKIDLINIISFDGSFRFNTQIIFRNSFYLFSCILLLEKDDGSINLHLEDNNYSIRKSPLSFRKLDISLKDIYSKKNNMSHLDIRITLRDLFVSYKKISEQRFSLNKISLVFIIDFCDDLINIKKESHGNIDGIPFSFHLIYDANERDLIKLVFDIELDTKVFWDVFPFSFNSVLNNIQINGLLHIRIIAKFSFINVKKHAFEVKILKNTVAINEFSIANFPCLNEAFDYSIYKNNILIKHLVVSKINRDYSSISLIPEKVVNMIIFSEDPNYYKHNGIDIAAIGYAIAKNIVETKFVRGGSTINMQVARNIFLNHDKNLARKIEEIIIVLLTEQYLNISKRRMLEIYLNIVEFAPKIYGINQAADFYFEKKYYEINILECLVLIYIIPRPIHFFNALVGKSQILKTNLSNHVKRVSNKMLSSGIITTIEFKGIENEIKFSTQFGSIFLV